MVSLDIGCGHAPEHIKKGDIGIDLEKGLCDVQASASSLPFQDETFSKVTLSHILEHLDNPGQALHEVKRVLKNPRGILEIEVPNPSSFWIFKDYVFSRKAKLGNVGMSKDHVCSFGESELQNLMRETGFKTLKIEYVLSFFGKKRMAHYGLVRRVFYRVLFKLFPAFKNGLKVISLKQ